ncbi:ABC transporter permease [Clostridium frigidicarnis]|uniref:Iron(III) transport system permease protein n=1 Tax=Clostridium frigidicarnis TaxID=84698 RepID=A0A1I0WA09_9CLOT|nr:iron ABC transporter permease [Clostridium frigidicarnis]SFA85108.1 iron(III) transport system permease protein [Clostridium frigidicarnis]
MRNKNKRVPNLGTRFCGFFDKVLIVLIISLIVLFILWPVIAVISKSLFLNGKFTLDLYKNIFTNNKKLIYNSLFVATITTIISTVFSIVISTYVYFSNNRTKKILMLILMLTMISPPFVSSLAYIQLFGRRGFITYKILKLNINPYGWQGIVSMQSLGFISLNSLMILGFIKNINKSLLQSSRDLGASVLYTFRRVLLPLMAPSIIVCSLLTFIRSLSDFGTPMTIGGAFNTLATEIYLKIIAQGDLPMAAAMNILILVPTILIFIPYRMYMKTANNTYNEKVTSNTVDFKFKGIVLIIFRIITYLFVVVMIVQYLTIFLSAITKFSYGKTSFTFEYIKYLKEYNASSIIRSIIYGLITGIIGTFIGMIISYYMERRKIRGRKIIDFIVTIPYIIPGTFFGIGYILAFNSEPLALTGTAFIVVLNCIFKQLPMVTKTTSASLSQINRDMEYSAKDLGANKFYILKDMIFPNVKSAFIVGFINNFTATMTTLGAVIFLIYPGQKVATIDLFEAINGGNYGVAGAISSIIIIITLLINIGFSKLVLRNEEY